MTSKGLRRMAIVDQTMETEGGFIPSMIYEGSADVISLRGSGVHAKPWIWGPTLDEAKAEALAFNTEALGLTETDMNEILASVMAASEKATAQREAEAAFPLTMGFVREGETAIQRMKGYNLRFANDPFRTDSEIHKLTQDEG